jgi:hypothetical protein
LEDHLAFVRGDARSVVQHFLMLLARPGDPADLVGQGELALGDDGPGVVVGRARSGPRR